MIAYYCIQYNFYVNSFTLLWHYFYNTTTKDIAQLIVISFVAYLRLIFNSSCPGNMSLQKHLINTPHTLTLFNPSKIYVVQKFQIKYFSYFAYFYFVTFKIFVLSVIFLMVFFVCGEVLIIIRYFSSFWRFT